MTPQIYNFYYKYKIPRSFLCSRFLHFGIKSVILRSFRYQDREITMKKLLTFTLAITALLSVQTANAWGGWAHRLVAYIAESHLTPEAKATAEKYLGSSIVDHATWMDKVPLWKKKNRIPGWEQTSWWHMCTVDKVGKNKYAISDKRSYKGDGDLYPNLVQCVENLKNYRNLTDSAVVINLKCILHMVGDMHCPSHIYYTEFEDCFARRTPEGKYIRRHDQMKITYNGKSTTSHRVWDGMSIREIWPEYGTELELFRVALDKTSPKKREKMCKGSIEEWVLQNAKDIRYIYDDITPGVAIDRKYLLDNQKLSKQQCLRAAYRLAHILNECLK